MVGQDMVNEDAGSLLSPIILHLQASYTTLQGCIDGWHRRALMHLPGVATAFLQIARYTFETGVADNNNQAITMPAAVTSPIFGHGLRSFRAVYNAIAPSFIMALTLWLDTTHPVLSIPPTRRTGASRGIELLLPEPRYPMQRCIQGYVIALLRAV